MRRSGAQSPFARLQAACEFWTDERHHVQCCEFADPEALEHAAETFDCASCPVAEHLDGLDADNRRAWNLVHVVCSRFLSDGHAIGPMVVALTDDLDEVDRLDLLQRMNLIYEVLVPPQRRSD